MSDSLNQLITSLDDSMPDIKSVFLFTGDGLLLSASRNDEAFIDDIGATAAAIKSVAQRSSQLLQRGAMQQVHIVSEAGLMVVNGIGNELVLVVLTYGQPNIGLMLHKIKSTSQAIAALLPNLS